MLFFTVVVVDKKILIIFSTKDWNSQKKKVSKFKTFLMKNFF